MDTKDLKTELLQIFQYLNAYNNLKNPVKRNVAEHEWHLWLDGLPEHETVVWNRPVLSEETEPETGEDFIVKIRRPQASSCPEPPLKLLGWLEEGWRAPENPVIIREQKDSTGLLEMTGLKPNPELFEVNPTRVAMFKEWLAKREIWATQQLKARKILEIYGKFYNLYAQMKREAERVELILADGILKAKTVKDVTTVYPLLIQRIELIFDSDIPQFKIVQSDQKPEFNSDILRQSSQINAEAIGDCRQEFETRIAFLYDNDAAISAFLKSAAAKLESGGRFTTSLEEFNRINEVVAILKRPVLILRNRTTGFASFVDQILEDIERTEDFPASLASILGFEHRTACLENFGEKDSFLAANGDSEAVLFSKEANLEQLQIVQKLDKSGAVLVQGPPGTGKTHTIANLIGHFLAQGKTVLVTSHTSKALRVLKEKIVPSLQPLCVAMFNEDREQLERCVEAITEYVATNNPEELEQEAAKLTAVRNEILTRLWEYKKRLLDLRKGEYKPVVIGGRDYSVKEAALLVAGQQSGNDWIPAPVKLGSVLPLAPDELVQLYKTNLTLSPKDETESNTLLPSWDSLMLPGELERLTAEVEQASSEAASYKIEYWTQEAAHDPKQLAELLARLRALLEGLGSGRRWECNARDAGALGSSYLKPWKLLLESITSVFEEGAAYQTINFDFEPEIPPELFTEAHCEQLTAMAAHLRAGKKFGWFTLLCHEVWKTLIERTRIKSAPPSAAEHFDYLRQKVQLEINRETLKQRWRKLIGDHEGPTSEMFGDEPEKGMRQYTEKINGLLQWYERQWLPLEQEFQNVGFQWKRFIEEQPVLADDASGLKRIAAACRDLERVFSAQRQRQNAAAIKAVIAARAEELEHYIDSTPATLAIRNLKQALEWMAPELYRTAYERLVELASKSRDVKLRREYLEQVFQLAPAWAEAIRNREGVHGLSNLPGDPQKAWEWRQCHDELEARGRENMSRLQLEIENLNQRLREVTVRLIEKKTWAKICCTSVAQRQALVGWKELIKKMGKRTGKKVPIYLAEARKLMPRCQAAVPVWIMPLIRVAENFKPTENKFDVVIIDEASQSDALALTALYLGKQVVVVGDDQQVSPDAVGQNQDEIQNLIQEFLDGIPNKQLYDGQSSVYDLAKCSFDPVCLREHFRCVAPIIEFSNRLSYDGRIKPLRDDSHVAVKPPTIAYHVQNGFAKNKINQVEAETIGSLIAACIEQNEYAEATFGVISLVGTEQAETIDAILRRRLPEKEYAKRQILCGNPAQFQGDERDVVFISVVDSAKDEGPLTLRGSGARDMYRKRYNVAASRARDQMWVVHSLDREADLKPDDLRLRLINHAVNPNSAEERLAVVHEKAESVFEREVSRYLVQEGYRIQPQWKVGSYRIDLVVLGRNQKIAIECDGEKYHTDENMAADMTRQAILERLGWRFIRIRGSKFFRNPKQTMAEVFEQLTKSGITPEYQGEAMVATQCSLVDQIIRKAEIIRRSWNEIVDVK